MEETFAVFCQDRESLLRRIFKICYPRKFIPEKFFKITYPRKFIPAKNRQNFSISKQFSFSFFFDFSKDIRCFLLQLIAIFSRKFED